jgi:hypothetical protein
MASPITWRTVETSPIGEISRAMSSGQAGINLGFDSFQKILDRQQATEQANWNQEKTNNTNAFMNELAAVKTPEEYAAAQDRLQQMLSSKGAQIDQQAGRQALGAQLGLLQGRVESNQKYEDGRTDFAQREDKDTYEGLIAQEDYAGAKAFLDAKTLRGEGKMQQTMANAQRDTATRKRTAEDQAFIDKLKAIERPGQLVAAEEKVIVDNTNRLAAAAGEAHTKEMDDRNLKVGTIANSLGLPVSASGYVKTADLSPESITKLNGAMKKAGIEDPDTYLLGDTKAADNFMTSLQGKVSPTLLKANEAALRGHFSSVGSGSIGVDAAARDRATAENEVMYEKMKETNWFSPGHPNGKGSYDKLADDVPKIMDKSSGSDPDEDVADLQQWVFKMANTGVEVSPGKFVSPPVEMIRNAIRGAKGGWFTDAQRTGAAEKILAESMSGVDIPKQIAESEKAQKFLNKQEVKRKINEK